MIIVRYEVRGRPGKTEFLLALLAATIEPSRAVDGVVSFDIGRDIGAPDRGLGIAVFADIDAIRRQRSLPEVRQLRELTPGLVAASPEIQIFEVPE